MDSISSLQADGQELEHIWNQYGQNTYAGQIVYSIPIPIDKPVVTWFGDIAKTIIANL